MTDEQQPSPGGGRHGADDSRATGATPADSAAATDARAGASAGAGPAAEGAAGSGSSGWGAHNTAGAAGGGGAGGAPELCRSRQHRVIGGVCAGLGRHFDMDPVLFRVPLAVLSVVGGLGLIFYGLAWLLMPAVGERDNELRKLLSGRIDGWSLAAVLVALVGCGLFLASLGRSGAPFSVMLLFAVVGAAYWSRHRRQSAQAESVGTPVDSTTAHAVAEAPPEAQAPPVREVPQWWQDPLTKGGEGIYLTYEGHHAGVDSTGYLWGPDEVSGGAVADSGGDGPPPGVHPRGGRPAPRRQRMGGLVFLLALAAAVAGTAVGWGSHPLGTNLTVGLACALAVFGAGLAVSAFVGRLGPGTIVSVLLTAVLLAGSVLLPKDIGTDWDHRRWSPATAAALQPSYRLDGGQGELDLSGLDLKSSQRVRTEVHTGAGALKVAVPRDATVRLDARVDAGQIVLPRGTAEGRQTAREDVGGLDRHVRQTLRPSDPSVKPKGTIDLKMKVSLGRGEIVRQSAPAPSDERPLGVPVQNSSAVQLAPSSATVLSGNSRTEGL